MTWAIFLGILILLFLLYLTPSPVKMAILIIFITATMALVLLYVLQAPVKLVLYLIYMTILLSTTIYFVELKPGQKKKMLKLFFVFNLITIVFNPLHRIFLFDEWPWDLLQKWPPKWLSDDWSLKGYKSNPFKGWRFKNFFKK